MEQEKKTQATVPRKNQQNLLCRLRSSRSLTHVFDVEPMKTLHKYVFKCVNPAFIYLRGHPWIPASSYDYTFSMHLSVFLSIFSKSLFYIRAPVNSSIYIGSVRVD